MRLRILTLHHGLQKNLQRRVPCELPPRDKQQASCPDFDIIHPPGGVICPGQIVKISFRSAAPQPIPAPRPKPLSESLAVPSPDAHGAVPRLGVVECPTPLSMTPAGAASNLTVKLAVKNVKVPICIQRYASRSPPWNIMAEVWRGADMVWSSIWANTGAYEL